MKQKKYVLLLCMVYGISAFSMDIQQQEVSNKLNEFQVRIHAYIKEVREKAKEICNFTKISSLGNPISYNALYGCVDTMERMINDNLRKYAKMSRYYFPQDHDGYDIAMEDHVQFYGISIHFLPEFKWEHYPELTIIKDSLLKGPKEEHVFKDWTCKNENDRDMISCTKIRIDG